MGVAIHQGDSAADLSTILDGQYQRPVFAPRQGVFPVLFPGELHSMHSLGGVTEISSVTREVTNERDAFNVGKSRLTVNDGQKWTLSLTGQGNAIALQAALTKQDLKQFPAVKQGQNVVSAGMLSLVTGDRNGNQRFGMLIPDCQVILDEVPGATDGESSLVINLETSGDIYLLSNYLIPIREVWYDGTSPADGSTAITNAAAPDGTLTAFSLGTGNNTGAGNTPLAVSMNKDGAGSNSEYILEVRVNGSKTTAYTYNENTGVITFTTAPADGAILEVVYCVRSEADSWESTKRYGIGQIVAYEGSYYISNQVEPTIGSDPATNTTHWDDYVGFGWDGSAGVGTPIIPYVTSNQYSMFNDWNNYIG